MTLLVQFMSIIVFSTELLARVAGMKQENEDLKQRLAFTPSELSRGYHLSAEELEGNESPDGLSISARRNRFFGN
jgi:hypothetical protein